MNTEGKIYVAGHQGLVGSAITSALVELGYRNLLLKTRQEVDLTDSRRVLEFFEEEKPEYLFMAAAKVGGIAANNSYPVDFLLENLLIEANVIQAAYRTGVKRLLFLGSSCIYPKLAAQPMVEAALLTGPLEPTNRPYAIAKIAGIEMCSAYNRQHGTKYLALMPTNLYGPGDSYDLENSHVIPAMIRKMHQGKLEHREEVILWGTGTPRREFLYSDDLADACIYVMNLHEKRFDSLLTSEPNGPLLNVGTGEDLTIRELATLVAEVVGFKGRLIFDPSKPDGTPRKLLEISKLRSLGWAPKTDFKRGLIASYANFVASLSEQGSQTPTDSPEDFRKAKIPMMSHAQPA